MKAFSMPPRFAASLMLVAFLLPAKVSTASDCLSAVGTGAASLAASMDDEGCEHAAQSSCVILACGSAAPAVRPMPTALVMGAGMMLLQVGAVQQPVDLYRTGPPTPPPNLI